MSGSQCLIQNQNDGVLSLVSWAFKSCAMLKDVEIIDLTTSSPLHHDSSSDIVEVLTKNRNNTPSKRGETPRTKPNGTNAEELEQKDDAEEGEVETSDDATVMPFFIDVAPSLEVDPQTLYTAPSIKDSQKDDEQKLLLPSHVTVFGDSPVEIIPVAPTEEDADFIDYLDYDDSKNTLRYYDEVPTEEKVIERAICKKCGAQGQHKTAGCPVMICLTCGVRDEHSTRSCPISKVCFTCGMKGHINATCPNRRNPRFLASSRETECDRCSSSNHKTNECPTWWRLYEYSSAEARTSLLDFRLSKKALPLGEGGEGYISKDFWCYNCGSSGHWGDDCYERKIIWDENSAFGLHNLRTGPFYDPEKEPEYESKPHPSSLDEDARWANDLPDRVGLKSRLKARDNLSKQRAREVEDDPDDWFEAKRQRQNQQATKQSQPAASGSTSTANPRNINISFAKRGTGNGNGNGRGPQRSEPQGRRNNGPPSLLERLGPKVDTSDDRLSSSKRDRAPRHRDRDRPRDDQPSSKVRRESYPNQPGPRYRGGYTR